MVRIKPVADFDNWTMEYGLLHLDTVDSTNNYLRHNVANADGRAMLVTAEYQSAGRGSDTNRWESERGKNLLFSLRTFPRELPVCRMFALSEVTALALLRALGAYIKEPRIKWPNDIYYGDGKMAGMLIENDLSGKSVSKTVIGVGLNVNQTLFVSDAPNPVSLAGILGREVDRREVLDGFVSHFGGLYAMMEDGEYDALHAEYMENLYRREGFFPYADGKGEFMACIEGVEPTGHLLLRDGDGVARRYGFKEVRFVTDGK